MNRNKKLLYNAIVGLALAMLAKAMLAKAMLAKAMLAKAILATSSARDARNKFCAFFLLNRGNNAANKHSKHDYYSSDLAPNCCSYLS